jgi:muramoyltetrapeptide carboxypeptidase LdcA involved in peptidoglycan recycling
VNYSLCKYCACGSKFAGCGKGMVIYMIYPKWLLRGDKIGVTATSEGFVEEIDIVRLECAVRHFENLGFPVIETNNVRNNEKGRSSSGKVRSEEFLKLISNPEVGVVIAASGGDYLMEMLPFIDYKVMEENPKWVQGYSDTTGLTFTITTNLDIASLYSYNFGTFGMENWHNSLENNIRILEGKLMEQASFPRFQDGFRKRITGLEEFDLDQEVYWKNIIPDQSSPSKEIKIKGRALGGCLDVLLNLVGTRFDHTNAFIEKYKEDGILWFLESFDLNSEALARGLWQLKEAGWFRYAKGFIFGRPAMFHSAFDISYEEAVLSVLRELKLPIILDVDIGHKPPQITMINGAITFVQSKNGKGIITFERR